MKTCSYCNETKPFDQFSSNRSDCKSCQSQRHKDWRSKDNNDDWNRYRAREYRRITKKGTRKDLYDPAEVKARYDGTLYEYLSAVAAKIERLQYSHTCSTAETINRLLRLRDQRDRLMEEVFGDSGSAE